MKHVQKIIRFRLWKEKKNGDLIQVTKFGTPIYDFDEKYKRPVPRIKDLKKYKSDLLVAINRYEWPIFYWKKNKQKKLVQIDSMGNTITDENQIIKLIYA